MPCKKILYSKYYTNSGKLKCGHEIAQLDPLCYCSLGLCIDCIDFHTQITRKSSTAMCYSFRQFAFTFFSNFAFTFSFTFSSNFFYFFCTLNSHPTSYPDSTLKVWSFLLLSSSLNRPPLYRLSSNKAAKSPQWGFPRSLLVFSQKIICWNNSYSTVLSCF